jgi:hypothetical protein
VRSLLCLCLSLAASVSHAQESWSAALSRMPLNPPVTELTRTNCINVLWHSFQSNAVVKGMVLMPGATDTWYLFRPAKVVLSGPNPSLFDALCALTNQTRIQVTFRPPLLLLHTDVDLDSPVMQVRDLPTAEKLRQIHFLPHAVYNDRDWDYLRPTLRKKLKVGLRPWRFTQDSWHFYRHTFVGWNLTGWETLEALALAAKTTCTIERKKVVFAVDMRLPTPATNPAPRQSAPGPAPGG